MDRDAQTLLGEMGTVKIVDVHDKDFGKRVVRKEDFVVWVGRIVAAAESQVAVEGHSGTELVTVAAVRREIKRALGGLPRKQTKQVTGFASKRASLRPVGQRISLVAKEDIDKSKAVTEIPVHNWPSESANKHGGPRKKALKRSNSQGPESKGRKSK
jgi:hypothetical protein